MNEIYELRAYLGKGGIFYTSIFTTLSAAKNEAAKLVEKCNRNKVVINGCIYTLSPVSGKFEPVTEKTIFFESKGN